MIDRGQAHTLEAFTAALLLVGGLIFALQSTALTPLSGSTSNEHIRNQQARVTDDLLDTAAENGTLQDAVLFWNTSAGAFENTSSESFYTNAGPPNAFGRLLNDTFRDQRIAFNVYVYHRTGSGYARERMVFMGSPSDDAVAASRMVTLFNDTELTGPQATSLENTSGFYAEDIDLGNEVYNVVEVRIVVWRM